MSYSQVKFLDNIKIDDVHCTKISLTKTQLGAVSSTTAKTWGVNTLLLAQFENNLEAGNITSLETITNWKLKRKASDETLFTDVATLDTDVFTYDDYTIKNNRGYIYSLHALTANGEGLGIEGTATPSFYGWYLFDVDETTIYKFDVGYSGIQTDKIQPNEDVYTYEGYSQYPVKSFGNRQYRTSRITTIPYTLSGNVVTIDVDILNNLRDFINNKSVKVLKNTGGELFYVTTEAFDYKYFDPSQNQPFEVSFEWTEVSDGSDL